MSRPGQREPGLEASTDVQAPDRDHAESPASGATRVSDAGRYPETGDAATEFAGGSARPRWASVLGACIVALVIVLIVVLHLSGVINPSGH